MKRFIYICFIFLSTAAVAQETLSFETVIKRTLEKNFAVLIERKSVAIAENNNNIGAAGYLPTVGVQADQSFSNNNTRQVFYSGQVNEKNGANNNALVATARLNWTFFDGFAMFARDKRLQLQEDLAGVNLTARMEMAIYQAAILYYSLQYNKQIQAVYEEAITLSKERFDLISLKHQQGAANDLQLLQSQLDLNADSSNYLNHLNMVSQMKADLAIVMGEQAEFAFEISPEIVPIQTISFEQIRESALSQNTSLLLQKSQLAIIDQQRKELQSRYYPQLSLYAQYAVNLSKSEVGILSSNRSLGPGVGLTLSWSILDGLSKVTSVKNNQLEKESVELGIQQQEQTVLAEVGNAWRDYEHASRLYNLESKSIVNTTEMFQIAQKSFENGSLTQFELREIQFSIIQAKNRQLLAELNLRTASLNLQLFTGDYKRLIP